MAAHRKREGGDEKKEEEEEEDGFTGSDNDSEFDEDMESLRKACILTGTDLNPPCSAVMTLPPESDSDNSDMDDYELARSVCQRFSGSADFELRPIDLKPISTVPPEDSDDGDDDFATLRAVQNRFSAYDQKAERSGMEDSVHNAEQVRASTTPLEKENSGPNVACQDSGYLERHQLDIHEPRLLPVEGSGFPRAAQLLLDAIKKNRLCQKLVHNRLVQIEARIEQNKKLKDRAQILKDFQVSSKKRVGLVLSQKKDLHVQLISAPKRSEMKTSAMRFGPEDNSDVPKYRDAMTKFPLALQRQRWSNEEKDNLRKGIKQEFQKALLKKSVDLISSYSEGSYGTSSDIDNVMTSIKGLEITPENIRAYLPKVDWNDFASVYNKGRSGAECEARWLNWEDPLKNNTRWTRIEDKELLLTVKEKEMSNWIDIAVSLGTNRTPFQCLARFQRSLNAQMVKREWEEEEDARLCAAVRVFGESNWQMVASVLDRRTGTQCSNRWKKTLNPARLRVGRWTIDEDKRMKVTVKLFGAKCWSKIAQFVPGRTQVQCRERWVNCLDPSLKRDPWTEEETMKLMTAIGEHNYCWSKIAACIPPRTDNQCRRRWMALCPDDVPKLQASKKIQQVALISNFVDREAERPDLGPEDFLPLPMLCAASEPNSEEPTKKRRRKPREKQASQMDSAGHTTTCSESRKKKRSRERIKEAHEATCDVVDGNEATICINDCAATIESSTIECPGSFECNIQGKDKSPLNTDLAPTSTDIGGKPRAHNSANRNKYKPRRKACTETTPVQGMLSVPATQSVILQNNSCGHEIPLEGGEPGRQNASKRKNYKPRRKASAEIAPVQRILLEPAAESVSLQTNNLVCHKIPVEGGESGTQNCSKRNNYKPLRKACAETAPVQGMLSVPSVESVVLQTNDSFGHEIPLEGGKPRRQNAPKRKNYKPRRKSRAEIAPVQRIPLGPAGQNVSLQTNNSVYHVIPVEGGKSGMQDCSKRKYEKRRRKVCDETALAQRVTLEPAAQKVPLKTNNLVHHEIPVEDNATSAEKERTSTQHNGCKKNNCSSSKKNNCELETTEHMQLRVPLPSPTLASISGVNGATSKSFEMDGNNYHEPSQNRQCHSSTVYQQGAENGMKAIDEVFADRSTTGLEDSGCILHACLIKKRKNASQTESENFHEANSRAEMNDKSCCEQASARLGEDDGVTLASFIKKKRKYSHPWIGNRLHKADKGESVDIFSVDQATTDLIEDDAPLASFIMKAKIRNKSRQSS
ncbi:unnamed protein product [Rhodiola kirilowii]